MMKYAAPEVPGLVLMALLIAAPVVIPRLYGHDWQRADQSVVASLSLLLLAKRFFMASTLTFSNYLRWSLLLIVALSFVSCFFSDKIYWAICEVSLAFACCAVAACLAESRKQGDMSLDRAFAFFIVALCAIKVLQFLVSTLAGYVTSTGTLDLDLLLEGFSNRRFYGQFQTFTLPLLAFPLLLTELKRSIKSSIFSLLACWWLIAIVGGTRGTWLGMAVAASALSLCGGRGLQWLRWQVKAMLIGLGLYWLIFSVLADWLGVELVNSAAGRLTTTLSARDIIWMQAWEMIKDRPFLGFGPMHFANIHNLIAAHPHQAILQWACEWGVPSAILVGSLVVRGVWATFRQVRRRHLSEKPVDLLRMCLFASLMGALAQAMVDGVIVMPYSQLWLAIVVGWLMGIHEWPANSGSGSQLIRQGGMVLMALFIAFLVYAVAHDFPNREERKTQFGRDFGGFYQPRFWQQGVIATKPQ